MRRGLWILLVVLLVGAVLVDTPLRADATDGVSDDGPEYAIVHYYRDDGDYGDHTTGDYNDFWGLHLWGDIDETIEWTAPKPFLGEDEYGRFAWVKLNPEASNVEFIVHRGDTKDGTNDDRSFDPSLNPEVWLRQDDETIYTSQAEAQGYVTVRYHREDGDYGDPTSPDYNDFWGLHLWGDAIDPSEGTGWTTPKEPSGIDDYGAFWNILVADASQSVNFIIHRGDNKDPGPDQGFMPLDSATVWIQSGDETIFPQRGAAEGVVTIHYHRPAGDYGDPTSPDYNDFWGVHTWGGANDPGWTTPRTPVGVDVFGVVFEVPLFEDAINISYILHRGDTKDPGPDQILNFEEWGYEVWQLQGADSEAPYILPITVAAFNTAPVADVNGPYMGNEGSSVTFDATGSTDRDGDALAFNWTFGDSEGAANAGPTPSYVYVDNGLYTVCVEVSDGLLSDTACTTAAVANVAPTVELISVSVDVVAASGTVDVTADFTDPGILDTHVAVWEWGDGSTSGGDVVEVDGDGTATGNHVYADIGVYTVTLTVTDKDGGSGASVYEFVAVYDPSAGFVTGGGWIDSPAGAYTADPSMTGKATFGFISKYKKGAVVPTGNTDFQFTAGDLDFGSSSYQWLVVTGSSYAKFKGVGTINDEGTYKFQVWAGDDEPDTFRIKIWTEDEFDVETVIYDNGSDQVIGAGNIVIHTKKK